MPVLLSMTMDHIWCELWGSRGRHPAWPLAILSSFLRAREGGPSASGFDPAAPARSYGDSSARADLPSGPFRHSFRLL